MSWRCPPGGGSNKKEYEQQMKQGSILFRVADTTVSGGWPIGQVTGMVSGRCGRWNKNISS